MNPEVKCPHDDCDEVLLLQWHSAYALSSEDLDHSTFYPLEASDAHSWTWQIECLAGHVILLPGLLGCPCDPEEQDTAGCPHNPDHYDWSEDYRNYRVHDRARLEAVMERIAGDPA